MTVRNPFEKLIENTNKIETGKIYKLAYHYGKPYGQKVSKLQNLKT